MKAKLHRLFLASCIAALASSTAHAQTWPAKPLKLVVPYAAGGSTDQLARAVADPLGRALGQPVVVENKPGGNTIVGAALVAKAAPDGYTLFMGSSASLALNPLLYDKLPYDPKAEFAGISMLAQSPLVMVVNPTLPVKTVKDFIALAKTQPAKLNYASVGNGNPLHLAGLLFESEAQVSMTHIPYNGSAPALTALLGNQVQVMFDVVLTSAPHIKAGKLTALGITGRQRLALLPGVPTVMEAGVPGYETGIWFALVVPKATPAAITARLNTEVTKILKQDDMKSRFDGLALDLRPTSTEEVGAFSAREQNKWARLVKEKGIRLEQ